MRLLLDFQAAHKMTLKILQATVSLARAGNVEEEIIQFVYDDVDTGISKLATHQITPCPVLLQSLSITPLIVLIRKIFKVTL